MTINGKEVQTRYGMLAAEMVLSKAAEMEGLSYFSTIGYAHIIYAGVYNFYKVKGQQLPVTLEEVYEYVEACTMSGELDAVNQQMQDFNESQYTQKAVESVKVAFEEVKKKTLLTKADASPTNPG